MNRHQQPQNRPRINQAPGNQPHMNRMPRQQQNPNRQQRTPNGDPRRRNPHHPYNSRPYISPEEQARRRAEAERRRAEAEYRRLQQLAYEKKQREREKAIRRQEFRENMKIAGGRFIVFLAVFAILLFVAAGAFVLSLHAAPDRSSSAGKITYFYGGTEVRTASLKDVVSGKDLYLCFNDLSEYLEMSESGTAQAMKFILPSGGILPETAAGDGSEESLVFLTDETQVIMNGQQITLDVPNRIVGTEIWVTTDFVSAFIENLSLQYDAAKREVRISRIKDEEHSTDDVTLYLAPYFVLKNTAPVLPIPEDPLIGDVPFSSDPNAESSSIVLTFKTDVSAYESYMNPEGDLRDAFLVLANADSPLDASYIPANLHETKHTSVISDTQYLSEYAAKALDALFQELKAAEFYSMAVYGSYRSYDAQSTLYEAKIGELMSMSSTLTRTQAEKNASFSVSPPGTDDHQTGLAVDMDTLGCVTTDFQYQPEFTWLTENAWKFGFILRYPRDKTEETGHAFEPWHYRYVGRYHAQRIHASGLSLEEYLVQIK